MIAWPEQLVKDLARRRVVVFLGAGVSRNSTNPDGRRPKTWEQFLRDACEGIQPPKKHIQSLLKQRDYLTACEVIRRKIGRDDFIDIVRDEFLTPGYQHAQIHENIFRLDSRIVATPNFDKIHETLANHRARGSIIVKHNYDPDVADAIRDDGRLILKVHGSIDSPNRLIFTRSEYARARIEHRTFYQVLDALAMTHTFIFVGCGVSDPDVALLLEDAFFRHPASRGHIMLIPRGAMHSEVAAIVGETMNLRMIEYSAADNHRELTESLAELADQVETSRERLRTSLNW